MSGDVRMAQGGGLGLSDWRFVLSVSLSLSSTCPVFSSVRGDWGSVDLRISPPGGVIIDPRAVSSIVCLAFALVIYDIA
jgi:hypothetical protein